MYKVFTKARGAEIRIDNHGTATNSAPALVPVAVAKELAPDPRFRIIGPEQDVVIGDGEVKTVVAVPDPAYHAVNGDVYHVDPDCSEGNNIERKNKRRGTGDKAPCAKCVTQTPAAPTAEEKE